MILTRDEIKKEKIVVGATATGERATTYDATVGKIITKKGECRDNSYALSQRGIAWVISNEIFSFPENRTGLATLRTTWTNRGILTLTLGIIDPGYTGPLATAVVNFGRHEFIINKNDKFFRVLVLGHQKAETRSDFESFDEYTRKVLGQTTNFSETFLSIDTLAPEILRSLFSMPRWVVYLSIIAIFFGFFSATLPIGYSAMNGMLNLQHKIEILEQRLDALENEPD